MSTNFETFDYNSKLNDLKAEFDKNYENNGCSTIKTNEDAKNYKFLTVLGQGAFGVVVRKL
jgi:hypothetical protein